MNKELPWYESVHMLSHIEITISKQNDIIASLGRALFPTHQNKTPPFDFQLLPRQTQSEAVHGVQSYGTKATGFGSLRLASITQWVSFEQCLCAAVPLASILMEKSTNT